MQIRGNLQEENTGILNRHFLGHTVEESLGNWFKNEHSNMLLFCVDFDVFGSYIGLTAVFLCL